MKTSKHNELGRFYELDFFGIKRKFPLSHISRDKLIANINIVGDIELIEKAGDELEKILQKHEFNYIVSPSIKVSNLVHNLALRFGQKRYIVLRKSIRGYMVRPKVAKPEKDSPRHVKKLVLNKTDSERIKGKKVLIVDDVVSTGYTMGLATKILNEAGSTVTLRTAIFKQGERELQKDIVCLAKLPIIAKKSPHVRKKFSNRLLTNSGKKVIRKI